MCSRSQQSRGMTKQVKSGFLLHYKKRFFGKDWREEFVILFADSTILWFRDRERASRGSPAAAEGAVVVREAPHMLAAGQWTTVVPQRPEVPSGTSIDHLMAIGTRHKDKVHWFLCKDVTELNTWMTAISNTLPPPPPQGNGTGNGPYIPSAPSELPPTVDPVNYQPPPAYIGSQGPLQQGPTTNNTTVIVQDRVGDGYNGGLSSGMGTGFATGVLTGSLLSGGWGLTGAGPCWGLGYGWGGGWGLGFGGGGGYHNHNLMMGHSDIHVNNYYDNDSTRVIHNHNTSMCGSHDDDDVGQNDFGVDCDASAYDGFDAGGFDFIF